MTKLHSDLIMCLKKQRGGKDTHESLIHELIILITTMHSEMQQSWKSFRPFHYALLLSTEVDDFIDKVKYLKLLHSICF